MLYSLEYFDEEKGQTTVSFYPYIYLIFDYINGFDESIEQSLTYYNYKRLIQGKYIIHKYYK